MMMFTRKWSRVWSQLALQICVASFAAAEINIKKNKNWQTSVASFKKGETGQSEKRSESHRSGITVAAMFYCLNPASAHATRHMSTRWAYDMMTARGNAVPSSSGEQQRQFLWLPQNSSCIVRERNAAASLHSWWPFQANHKSHHENAMTGRRDVHRQCLPQKECIWSDV